MIHLLFRKVKSVFISSTTSLIEETSLDPIDLRTGRKNFCNFGISIFKIPLPLKSIQLQLPYIHYFPDKINALFPKQSFYILEETSLNPIDLRTGRKNFCNFGISIFKIPLPLKSIQTSTPLYTLLSRQNQLFS